MRSFLINELEPFAYIVYLAALLLHYRYTKQVRHKVLSFYYALSFAILYTGVVITSIDNGWSYNLLFFVNICVFSWYFYHLLANRWKRLFILLCFTVNASFFVYTDVWQQKFMTGFNGIVYGVAFLSIVLYTFFYLYQLLANVGEENLLLNFDFWLTCGFLLYFLGSFVIIIYYDDALPQQRGDLWEVHNIILLVCAVSMVLSYCWIVNKQTAKHG